MKKNISLIGLIIAFGCNTASRNDNNASRVAQENSDDYFKCIKSEKYSSDDLRKLFPLENASIVKLVSFKQPLDDSASEDISHVISVIGKFYSKDRNGINKLDSSKIVIRHWFEEVNINHTAITELGDIFFNYNYAKPQNYGLVNNCIYDPRNAILFYNPGNQIYAAVELCFKCDQYRVYPDTLSLGEWCTEKFDVLKGFFIKRGIKYGLSSNH